MAKENMRVEDAEQDKAQRQAQAGLENEAGHSGGLVKESSEAAEEVLDQQVAALTAEVKTFQEEARQNYDKYIRAMAEMDNIRRRSEREKRETHQYALESFFKSMVPVLDSFDQAMAGVNLAGVGGDGQQVGGDGQHKAAQTQEFDAFAAGVTLVHKQLMAVLGQQGLEAVDSIGAKFDPNLHQAIQKVESEDADTETVQEEYSKGYTLNGRLLRPAMVRVLMPKE